MKKFQYLLNRVSSTSASLKLHLLITNDITRKKYDGTRSDYVTTHPVIVYNISSESLRRVTSPASNFSLILETEKIGE